ncbi:unnamed protein product [Symbiodinium natans]|uniref:Uncharacterized protein n=1 Tax=Symbiodinium natans TaxID=878477 RepID=A0A812JPZ5_9DINO|nr:unnamed protein product [Symbiodinium natans]
MHNHRSWENRRETIFELLRRCCIQSARSDCLDSDTRLADPEGVEDAWLFLLTLRRRSPVRKRRIDECLKALLSSDRWMQALKRSPRVLKLLDEDDESKALLTVLPDGRDVDGATPAKFSKMSPKAMAGTSVFSAAMLATEPNSPVGEDAARPSEMHSDHSIANIDAEGAPSKTPDSEQKHTVTSKVAGATVATFQAARDANQKYGVTDKIGEGAKAAYTKARDFEQQHHVTSKVAGATVATFQAARDANQKYGVTDKIGEGAKAAYTKARDFEQQHHVTSKVAGATVATFQAARDANQKYGVTDKIGEGAKAAYTKARDFEQQHHVTSQVANGLKAGASGAASAASSLAKGSNPFAQRPSPEAEVNARNPFREARNNGNPFR